jgi:serine/threonine protein phosphatase PrpC
MIELDIAEAETIGARAEQQDAAVVVRLGVRGDTALLVLADGLGGHANGAEAAGLVIDTFRDRATSGAFVLAEDRRSALLEAIEDANHRIRDASDPTDGERSMGSTAVAAVIAEGRVRWISVGDSHLFVWRRGRLAKLNADHSQAGIMIRQGFAPDDPAVLGSRSLLASALLGRTIEEMDCPVDDVALAVGDVVLLASDGLNTLSDAEVSRVIGESVAQGAEVMAGALVAAVLSSKLPRQDNATVLAARILGSVAPASPDDEVPNAIATPRIGEGQGPPSHWPLAVGLGLLLAMLASVIMTQM